MNFKKIKLETGDGIILKEGAKLESNINSEPPKVFIVTTQDINNSKNKTEKK
jgi:hypothetical protein